MKHATCRWCGGYIETSNRAHPGYCSPGCRDAEQQERRDRRRHEGEGGSELHDRDRRGTLEVSLSPPEAPTTKPIKNGAGS